MVQTTLTSNTPKFVLKDLYIVGFRQLWLFRPPFAPPEIIDLNYKIQLKIEL